MSRSSDSPTIRLQNMAGGNTQLNLHLMRLRPKASPGLRRGVVMTPVRILPGQYYDVCKELGVSLEEARRLIAQSPEVKAHQNARRLMVREFPTTADQAAEDARIEALRQDAERKTAALNPPDPPNAVPPGVDLEAAGLPPDTPRMTRPAVAVEAPEIPSMRSFDDASADEDTLDEAPVVEEEEAVEEEPVKIREPSMDWTVEELQEYAAEHHVDLGRSTSKTAMLKKIRKALGS